MSSSNLVRVVAIPEVSYGVTPATGPFQQARFVSESLSGTPGTTESAQIRTDRMSSGQIVTGLTVGGQLSFELAKEAMLESFMSSAMNNDWETFASQTVDLALDVTDPTDKRLTRSTGSFIADAYVPGQIVSLSGFTNAVNNVQVQVAEVVSATVIRVIGPEGLVTETATGSAMKRADRLQIGATKKSFSMEKKFLDLTDKAITYRGMIASQMDLTVTFGELIKGSFNFSGNDYETVDVASDMITDGRTITPSATSNTMNGSIDMPFLATSAVGELDSTGLDIQSVTLSLNNNVSAQNVIGDIAPRDYSLGTAAITVGINTYLKDASWALLAKKLNQASFAVGFMVRNQSGFYGIYMPAVQVSFDDPASGGQNQDISLDMKGTAKVGDSGESALVIFRG